MADQIITIKCPNPKCQREIPLTDALTEQIEQRFKERYEADLAAEHTQVQARLEVIRRQEKELEEKRQAIDKQVADQLEAKVKPITEQLKVKMKAFAEREREKIKGEYKEQTEALQEELAEKSKKLSDMQRQEIDLRKKQRDLEEKQQAIDEHIAEQVKAKHKAIAEQERKKVLDEYAQQTKALEEALAEKSKKLSDMQKQEIDLRKRQRELEHKEQELKLDNQRKLDEERKNIFQDAVRRVSEERDLKDKEKDEQLESMKKKIDELKRKAEGGGPDTKGPALEHELREKLERIGPYDKFEEVKKGVRGADLVQTVHNTSGKECGKILWEAKNTKDFQRTWIDKLKRDQQQANADIAVIVSVALPNDIDDCFGIYEDVWVTDLKSSAGLATALRGILIEGRKQEIINAGRESVKDVVYNYITSREFSLHIRAVVNSYQQMQEDLESEKRSMAKIWNKREKQISTILDNVAGMYGSIEGLLGNQKALPEIEALSLAAIGDSDILTE